MSLTIGLTTPEAVILSADSRQTYRNNIVGTSRIGSDSATKIFPLTKTIGVTVAGPAFLMDPKHPTSNERSIGSFIHDFRKTKLSETDTLEKISANLKKFFEGIYQPEKKLEAGEKELEKKIRDAGGKILDRHPGEVGGSIVIEFTDKKGGRQHGKVEVPPISLIVAGYNPPKKDKELEMGLFLVYIPGPVMHKRKQDDRNQYGASWTGQSDVLQRVVLGYDARILSLEPINALKTKIGEKKLKETLGALEYRINWGAMNVHDAISFSKLMIESTSAIQEFSDGIMGMPGGIPGVGGHVDIAVIDPQRGFLWHSQKSLPLSEPTELLNVEREQLRTLKTETAPAETPQVPVTASPA